ncbi:MAG: cobalt-precorrin 5A hydrolase [Methanomicrobiales archaeon]|nr:cobalt-precorrin 5A hydrolase [Methanomicrobiales archaeon]
MTGTVVIAMPHALGNGELIARTLGADLVPYSGDAFRDAFSRYRRIVALMAAGIAVRQLAPLIQSKWEDPAVVVVSPDLAHAIPILGGHHGGNALARELQACLGIQAVITTATEAAGRESVEGIAAREGCTVLNRTSTRAANAAMLEGDVPLYAIPGPGVVIAGPSVSILLRGGEYVVGIGCRRGVSRDEVLSALSKGLRDAGIGPDSVLAYATTERKRGESALSEAVSALSGNLVFLQDAQINAQPPGTPSAAARLGLQGVAEPCARALSGRKEIVMAKRAYGRVTVAVAR